MSDIQIEDLIPYGEENAVSRADLTKRAELYGLIPNTMRDKDRGMRALVAESRLENAIVSAPSGGYYRPTSKDITAFKRYIDAETGRAIQIFRGVKFAEGLYEDMRKGLVER